MVEDQLVDMSYSYVQTLCLGVQGNKTLCHGPVQKPNTSPLQMQQLRLCDYKPYCERYKFSAPLLQNYGATILVSNIYQLTRVS
jgi:hypothetical protein